MGFSYGEWKGVFYPAGVTAKDYLNQYARIFNSVEMDTTFYAVPRIDVVLNWASAVPDNFRFAVKTPQTITHEMGLENSNQFMDEFIKTVKHLGDKLGVILIQLPPSYKIDRFPIFTTFVNELPGDIRFAVEFRHRSWFTSQTGGFLSSHNICWVTSEYSGLPHQIIPTTDFLYFRWLGKHAAFRHYDREQIDRCPRLMWWAEQIKDHLDKIGKLYGFFNNDYSGFAPTTCNRFKTSFDLPVVDFQQPKQGRLF